MTVTKLQKCGSCYTYTSYTFQQKPIITQIDNKNNHDT